MGILKPAVVSADTIEKFHLKKVKFMHSELHVRTQKYSILF